MNISISHSTSFDFEKELYEPIQKSFRLRKHKFFFPEDRVKNTRDVIKSCDIMIADVSYPSTGTGIEIGWASTVNKPIYCVYKKGTSYSFSLKFITQNFYEYTEDNLTKVIHQIIKDHQRNNGLEEDVDEDENNNIFNEIVVDDIND
ncbi:MAG: nucleoside 2-deoxyribosyltransferase [Clostridia bacterium]|nr:nucleoside 2-deoxyribosyltransferase [Clostridia bacterium]